MCIDIYGNFCVYVFLYLYFANSANMGRKRLQSKAKDLWLIPVTTPVFQFVTEVTEHWFNPYGQQQILFMGPVNVVFKVLNLSFSQKDWKRKEYLWKSMSSLSTRDILNGHFPVSTSAQDLGTLSSWSWECAHSNAGSVLLVWEEPKDSSGGQSYTAPTYPSTLCEQ